MTLLYFAWVRQKIGRSEEHRTLPDGVTTVGALARYLSGLEPGYSEAFADLSRLRAAVNQEHVSFDAIVADGDEVAFFPPVTGG